MNGKNHWLRSDCPVWKPLFCRQVASHPSAQSAQSQALFVPNVSQLQQELNGSRYVTYQNPWMATLRSAAVRARTGFASHPTYTYNIHGSQPSPGTVFTQSQVSPTLPQPTNRLHHRTMVTVAICLRADKPSTLAIYSRLLSLYAEMFEDLTIYFSKIYC